MKAAHQVLHRAQVNGGFPSDGAIHLGHNRGGDVEVVNASHVSGSHEPTQIADHPATHGNEQRLPVRTFLQELARDALHHLQALGCLARGDEHHGQLPGADRRNSAA